MKIQTEAINFELTELLKALISLAAMLISCFVIPWLREKLSAEKYENLRRWVKTAVGAAEQLYKSKTGQEKKEYVISFLLTKGIVFDIDQVTAMIEDEVRQLSSGEK